MRINKKAAALAVAAVVTAGTGVAYAYWTTTGSGAGSASATNNDSVTNGGLSVLQSGTITGLVPDGTPKDINATVANLSAYDQSVGIVTAAITGVKNAAGADITATCATGNFAVVNADPGTAVGVLQEKDAALNADERTMNAVATVQLVESGPNQDGCENAVPQFSLTAARGA